MKLENFDIGQTLYQVSRRTMGNTTIKTTDISEIKVIEVNPESRIVTARVSGGPEKRFTERSWSKWRIKKPALIRTRLGNARLATRTEVDALKSAEQIQRLAGAIKAVDPDHRLGAGALAEALIERRAEWFDASGLASTASVLEVDRLSNVIRRADGNHDLSPEGLATHIALMKADWALPTGKAREA